jgi:uridine phosphorylase
MLPTEKMYHINLDKKMIKSAEYAILPGDPQRVEKIASYLDNPEFLSQSREYTSYLGYIKNKPILVMSTGMGGPSAAIAVEELAMIGIKNIIRVGTCGGMQDYVRSGDIIIASSAVRHEGTSREYMPIEYPAVADFDLTYTLKESAEKLGYNYHIGTVHCKDSFYGQHSPERMPVGDYLKYKWDAFIKGGVLASEMDTASVFTVSSVLRIKSGAVLLCVWNQAHPEDNNDFDTSKAILTAIEALKMMIC